MHSVLDEGITGGSHMDERPLVSVVIIFLNAEKFLAEAAESVFAQTYDRWELLLVDDGSSDGSTQRAQYYAAERPDRIRYVEHDGHRNRGMSASRNLGIRNAQGEYIAFLDADDVWLPLKLEQQVAILRSKPEAGMVYGLCQYWYSWSGDPDDRQRDVIRRLGVNQDALVRLPDEFNQYLQAGATPGCPSTVLARRELVDRVGGFEEQFPGLGEDWAFYAKALFEAPAVVAGECWVRYRQHPDSDWHTATRTGTVVTDWLTFLSWLAEYLSARGIEDKDVWQKLQAEIWRYRHPTLARVSSRGVRVRGLMVQRIVQIMPLQVRRVLRTRWPHLATLASRWVG